MVKEGQAEAFLFMAGLALFAPGTPVRILVARSAG